MLRPQVLLLILICLCIFALPMHTSMSQGTNHSLSLNGTTAYLSVPNSTSINISGPITIEAWIKVNTITGNYQDIVCREAWTVAGTGGGYEFAITNTGKLRLDLYQSHNQYTTVIGSTNVSAGIWHHVAGVFDGSQMRLYLNGTLDGSLSTTNGPASGTSPLNVGKSTYGSYYFGGSIDQVRISAAALYNSNFTAGLGPENQTRAFWKFNGQTTNDLSGNFNHGTLQGTATYSTNVPPDINSSPVASLTHPQNNTSFTNGASVVIDATAMDSDGVVSKVDFYQSSTLLGTDTTAPYSFTWNNVPGGVYSITAKATDDNGAVTTSSAITVNVLDSVILHSLSLNGTSGYVSVPNSSSINITGPITIEAWIKVNAITGNYQDIVCRESWGQAGSGGGYEFAITSTGKVRLDLYQSHNQYTTVIGSTTVTTGAWQHVAGVFDGSQMRVYLNGVLDGSLSTTNGPASGTSPLNIGKSTYTTYYFGGLIDEVRVSAASLYNSNFTPGLGPASQTRAYWKFDGQNANDASGNGNHGTLQSSATYSTSVPTPSGSVQRPLPTANGPYSGLTSQAVQLSSIGSSDPDGTIVNYQWNFGDGASTNAANPSHTYAGRGIYTATLTVTDNTGLLASVTTSVTVGSSSDSRIDPLNATGGGGENPLSQNFNWNVPLVSLPGRAGLDLNLALSYNSLVWTKADGYILFDDDRGFPSPGFRLGFPVIQQLYYNSETGKHAYLLISPDGRRTELRRVGNSILFEAADSSHVLLDANNMTLHTPDGMRLSYVAIDSQFYCTEIKDRNGNYISVEYVSGRLNKVIDTLGREIRFNYNGAGLLISITQTWNQGQPTETQHPWAEFTYTDTSIQTSFVGLSVNGPANNTTVKMLSKVTLADDSHFDFSYTSWGQVWKIAYIAADSLNNVLNYRTYNLPGSPLEPTGPQVDCPRFTQRRDWAKYWNGDTDGTLASNEEAVTTFSGPVDDTWTMPGDSQTTSGKRTDVILPDGTITKSYFVDMTGIPRWSRGLPALVETASGGTWQRRVKTIWTQDDTSVDYLVNPRVVETNIYDPTGNRVRTEITYQQFVLGNNLSCRLPQDLLEYAADATTVLRTTRTNYNMHPNYTDRRLLGLPSEKLLYQGTVSGSLVAKTAFFYDEDGAIQGADTPIQHDNNYTANFVGRGNLTSVKRYNVNSLPQSTTTSSRYNTAGVMVSSKDASNHEVQISYADSFSDGNNARGTLAYPTTLTDADGYSSTVKYNFDFGGVTYSREPQPNGTSNLGPEQTFAFDNIGRLQQVTNLVNNAYTRFVYVASQLKVERYTTIKEGSGESLSFRITDGLGRTIATANDHPGSNGGFSGQRLVYDIMGRVIKTSNPTETSASGSPFGWNTRGDDQSAGWIYSEQTYDWKGRPLAATNQDGTTKTISYSNCGCAGSQVMTLTDEGTLDGGVSKRRQQKIYSDVLGRIVKTEFLNWESGSVFATTTHTYNATDRVTLTRRYAGTESSGTYQDTIMTYDGYGRLASQHIPEQNDGTSTTWTYNADDTVLSVTDARGAATTYAYNGRHLTTGITYSASGGIPVPAPVTYGYDAAGNRSWMNENGQRRVTYHYNSLSLMDWEDRQFPGLTGTYRLSYDYNLAGQLKSVTDPTNSTINYVHDRAGRVTEISGTPYGTGGINGEPYTEVSQYASNLQYRAWGALKSLTYGSQLTLSHGFNQRLQLSQFVVGNLTSGPSPGETRLMSSSFQYYADGNLRSASDNLRDVFDRAYAYNHVGGAKEAYSGSEARDFLNGTSSETPTGPYRHSFQHDAFGNVISNTMRFWSQSSETTNIPYTKNRKQGTGISYDVEGNLTQDNDLQYTYDAAGRSASIFSAESGKTITPVYDGDGQVVHRIEVEGSTTIANLFQLRSTVMGGRVVTELDSAGQKKKGYVYCNGRLIARQEPSSVTWHHENPFTGSRGGSIAGGFGSVEAEPDVLGVDMGFADPFPQPEQWEPPQDGLIGLLPGSGVPSGRCTVDGIAILCSEAMELLWMGAAQFEQPTAVWNDGWKFVNFNRNTGRHETELTFSHYESTSVTVDGETSRNWTTVYNRTIVASETEALFRMFAFRPSVEQSKKSTPATSPQKPVDWAVLQNSLKTCITELWEWFAMKDFKAVTAPPGEGGKKDDDKFNGVITIHDAELGQTFKVVTDPTPPPEVKTLIIKKGARGATDVLHPFWNYAYPKAGPTLRPGDLRYPELFMQIQMDYVRVQIHELGASLSAIRNIYHPGPWAKRLKDGGLDPEHDDDGPSLEDCVGRLYYEQMGLKPNLKPSKP